MGSTVVVRYTTRADAAEENQQLVEKVFAELAATEPDGLRYATFRLADGVSFVHVAMIDGDDNPLLQLAAFQEFTREIGERCVDGPTPSQATVVGSYRFTTA
jgi:hypothetical protein